MKKLAGWLVVVLLIAGAAYLWWQNSAPAPQVLEAVEAPPAAPVPAPQAEPAIRYPIAENKDEQLAKKPLPALDESDRTIWDSLSDLLGRKWLNAYFQPERIVRHIVVTVDNLPRKTVAVRLLPTKQLDGNFAVAGSGKELSIAPENAARYAPFVRVAETVDAKRLVAIYVHFYPLFQRAYQELGYPKEYFNDRLVAVIDHLLAAPEIAGPVMLTQPHVLYRFADPELEQASAGHKVLIRMGSENAAKVKAKLREIRRELTGKSPADSTQN